MGAINWDVTLFVQSLPTPGQEVAVSDVARVPGGTGANVAVAAARLLSPGKTAFIGALGDDSIAERQREILESDGVAAEGIVRIPDVESGQAFILVDAHGQNVIASALGANALLTADHIRQPHVRDMFGRARAIAVTDPPLPVIEAILAISDDTGCRVSWDPGFLVAEGETILHLARQVDTLLLNEDETATLFGSADPQEIADTLRSDGWNNRIVLKRGGQGATVLDFADNQLIHVPPLPLSKFGLTAVSSVGAGDAFHGALAALDAERYELTERLLGASVAAGINVSRPGTRDTPNRDQLMQTLASWREMGISMHINAL